MLERKRNQRRIIRDIVTELSSACFQANFAISITTIKCTAYNIYDTPRHRTSCPER